MIIILCLRVCQFSLIYEFPYGSSGYMIFIYSEVHCVSVERFVFFALTE